VTKIGKIDIVSGMYYLLWTYCTLNKVV